MFGQISRYHGPSKLTHKSNIKAFSFPLSHFLFCVLSHLIHFTLRNPSSKTNFLSHRPILFIHRKDFYPWITTKTNDSLPHSFAIASLLTSQGQVQRYHSHVKLSLPLCFMSSCHLSFISLFYCFLIVNLMPKPSISSTQIVP